jgi:hypothetical protein
MDGRRPRHGGRAGDEVFVVTLAGRGAWSAHSAAD